MRKNTNMRLIMAFIVCLVYLVLQSRKTHHLQLENAALQEQVMSLQAWQPTNSQTIRAQAEAAELEQARSEKSELLRLRNEVAQLRRKVKEDSGRQPTNGANLTGDSTSLNDILPYQTYTAQLRATLDWNKTLIAGGWAIHPGKRTLVFISPGLIGSDGEPDPSFSSKQVRLETTIIEVPEKALEELGMNAFKAEGNKSAVQAVFTDELRGEFMMNVEKFPGVDIMHIPAVTTLDNRQTEVGVWDTKSSPSGEHYRLGPVIDLVPHISNEGRSVDLSVFANINVPKSSAP